MSPASIHPFGGHVGHGPDAAYALADKGYVLGVEDNLENWATLVCADSCARLAAVKAEYDPDNVFTRNVIVDSEDA